jgi:hypothetical protein
MLQGSLDNFALDEVLGLLSSTSKTGKLDLKGDRGAGSLVLNQGQLVDATASNTANGTTIEDVLFELLRFSDGSFTFTATESEAGDTYRDVGEALAAAEGRLADWRTIESVVPSLGHVVTLVPELPADEITVNRQEWAVLNAIAAGCPVSQVCDDLDLGEVEGSRQIKDLAERNLVMIGSPGLGTGPSRSGVEALATSTPNDPFARRAMHAAGTGEAGAPPPPPLVTVPPILENGRSKQALATAPADSPGVQGGIDRRAPRPPKPAPPSAREPTDATGAEMENGAPSGDTAAGNGDDGSDKPETKPGGLLMRYLKSDG